MDIVVTGDDVLTQCCRDLEKWQGMVMDTQYFLVLFGGFQRSNDGIWSVYYGNNKREGTTTALFQLLGIMRHACITGIGSCYHQSTRLFMSAHAPILPCGLQETRNSRLIVMRCYGFRDFLQF
jgi:hypothetical protein